MTATTFSETDFSMFGLTENQTRLLYSIEKLLVQQDITFYTENNEKKRLKRKWLENWIVIITDSLTKASLHSFDSLMSEQEVLKFISEEQKANVNNTWYYLVMLEATLFRPYFPLGTEGNSDESNGKAKISKSDKEFSKLKYTKQNDYIKKLVRMSGIMDEKFIDRFERTYKQSIAKISGKVKTIAIDFLIILAAGGIIAATAGAFAGPIAVALLGDAFVGLSGAALTSACLALAGGGAIAIGGAGIAGGVLAIVGGGALLGLGLGGAVTTGLALLIKSSPQLALSQAAKLEVVLKEIVLNAQQDIKIAQHVIEDLKNQVVNLKKDLAEIETEMEKNKEEITKLKKIISYLEKALQDMRIFASSYEEGLNKSIG